MYAIFILFNIDNKINTLYLGKSFLLDALKQFPYSVKKKEKEQ
jgi:hypothetical protein